MKNYLLGLSPKLLQITKEIGRAADRKKLPAYVVGGIVRDLILNRRNLDLDILVEQDGVLFAQQMATAWNKRLIQYAQFKTATVEVSLELNIDFATARSEQYPYPGALPVVQEGSLEDDLFRRDFTINALAISINHDSFGNLMDVFGGLKDIQNKQIRVMHDKSFVDDPTRMLRAVRFEQRLGFRLENHTEALFQKAVIQKAFFTLKPPRYFEELKKVLKEQDPLKSIRRLNQFKVLLLLDELLKMDLKFLSHLDGNIKKLKKQSYAKEYPNFWFLYFMGLLDGISHLRQRQICQKFQLTKEETATIMQSRGFDRTLAALGGSKILRSDVYTVLGGLTESSVLYLWARAKSRLVQKRIEQFLKHDRHVRLKVTGNDLHRLGIPAGKRVGKVLKELLSEKINRRMKTKKAEMSFVHRSINGTNRKS